MIQNANDAKIAFLRQSGVDVDFYPFIINFYKNGKITSSLCWKGFDEKSRKHITLSALPLSSHLLNGTEKTEYIPLNKGETVIIEKRIFTIDENSDGFCFMELPFIFSEKYAISIAKTLIRIDTNDHYWMICAAKQTKHVIGYLWIGLHHCDQTKNIILPLFPNEHIKTDLIDEMSPINISETIVINNKIYQVCYNNDYQELEYLCELPQGLNS